MVATLNNSIESMSVNNPNTVRKFHKSPEYQCNNQNFILVKNNNPSKNI